MKPENHDPRFLQARGEVRALRGLYQHLATYALVVGALLAVNLVGSPSRLWIFWVALGWGIALAAHALRVIAFKRIFGHAWEERQIARRLNAEP